MRDDDRVRLRHLMDAAREAMSFVVGKTRSDLDRERLLALALVREIEIVGEAASRLSSEATASLPSVPWPEVISMRNRLIHAYFDVDLDVVWATVTEDLPSLVETIETVVADD